MLIDDLRAMAIFAETVERGSFRAAARALSLSPSVVSYHITQLEQKLGCALLYRSTRSLSLTHEGQRLLEHTRAMLGNARQGLQEVTRGEEVLKGSLKISLPTALVRHPIGLRLAALTRNHPTLALSLHYTDDREHLIQQGIDLAIRAGTMTDSDMKARRIGEIRRRLVASAGFVKGLPEPSSPDALSDWPWIRLSQLPERRVLSHPEEGDREICFRSAIEVNNVEAMTLLCAQGYGLATPPDHLVSDALRTGEMVEVLSSWTVQPIPLYAVWPGNVIAGGKVHQVLECLLQR